MNKPTKIDNFLYRHFKFKGYTPANILVQPVENNNLLICKFNQTIENYQKTRNRIKMD